MMLRQVSCHNTFVGGSCITQQLSHHVTCDMSGMRPHARQCSRPGWDCRHLVIANPRKHIDGLLSARTKACLTICMTAAS